MPIEKMVHYVPRIAGNISSTNGENAMYWRLDNWLFKRHNYSGFSYRSDGYVRFQLTQKSRALADEERAGGGCYVHQKKSVHVVSDSGLIASFRQKKLWNSTSKLDQFWFASTSSVVLYKRISEGKNSKTSRTFCLTDPSGKASERTDVWCTFIYLRRSMERVSIISVSPEHPEGQDRMKCQIRIDTLSPYCVRWHALIWKSIANWTGRTTGPMWINGWMNHCLFILQPFWCIDFVSRIRSLTN